MKMKVGMLQLSICLYELSTNTYGRIKAFDSVTLLGEFIKINSETVKAYENLPIYTFQRLLQGSR
mgnify:CR=1 FL=1